MRHWFIGNMHKKLGIEKFRLMINSKTDKRYGEKEHLIFNQINLIVEIVKNLTSFSKQKKDFQNKLEIKNKWIEILNFMAITLSI